jgi:23S rRNA pseudouridine1911/1915/1917 synthase
LVALDPAAFDTLRALLKAGELQKHYIALCWGALNAPRSIDLPLYPDKRHPQRVKAWKKTTPPSLKVWQAHTQIQSATTKGAYCEVQLSAHRAFRHQLRVHLAAIGHPIVGDTIYGAKSDKRPDGLPGHMLHASAIRFTDPWTKKPVEFTSPAPWKQKPAPH